MACISNIFPIFPFFVLEYSGLKLLIYIYIYIENILCVWNEKLLLPKKKKKKRGNDAVPLFRFSDLLVEQQKFEPPYHLSPSQFNMLEISVTLGRHPLFSARQPKLPSYIQKPSPYSAYPHSLLQELPNYLGLESSLY